jgi:hypothetical protein
MEESLFNSFQINIFQHGRVHSIALTPGVPYNDHAFFLEARMVL